jgi:hypothetical protein
VINPICQEFSQNENFHAMHNGAIVAVNRAAPMAEFTKERKTAKRLRDP